MKTLGMMLLFAMSASVGCDDSAGPADLVQVVDPDMLGPGDLCTDVADPCGDEGFRECVAEGGFRECREVGGCLQWGFVTGCEAGKSCVEGQCAAACVGQACTIVGAKKCGPTDASNVLTCDDFDQDGCLEWGDVETCEAPELCASNGVCGTDCRDECADGFTKCEGDAVLMCGEYDGDGCLEWGAPSDCPASCSAGGCVDVCTDECPSEGFVGCEAGGNTTCARGGNGCLQWGTAVACPMGTTCSAGTCSEECTDECPQLDQTACDAGGVKTCGNFDTDSCHEWSPVQLCVGQTSCNDGVCTATCADECTTVNATRCEPAGLGVQTCGNSDTDACLEWATTGQCDPDETCSLGVCSQTCVDECTVDETRCRAGSESRVESCANGDADACLEWVETLNCSDSQQVCADGACADTCQDECDVLNTMNCIEGAAVSCGEFDGDPCKDLGTPDVCDATQVCADGACVDAAPTVVLKISEVLYNARGEDNDVFLEVWGPAGTDLAGFALVGVNGATNQDYRTIQLAGSIPANGYFVVTQVSARAELQAAADLVVENADLQNGPDNLELRFGGSVVDALGYGNFGPQVSFRGEGTAANGADVAESLARDGQVTDTDNNHADFAIETVPTPGGPPVVRIRPTTDGQVVVTEIMADPDTLSDTAGEWLELYNPSETMTMALEGCVIGDGDGEAHTIVGALDVPPGGHVTLSRGASPGFVPDYVFTQFTLTNGQDEITLECGQATIAAVFWQLEMITGISWSRDPAAQAPTGFQDVDGGGWCLGASSYNGDFGTPGWANPPCPGSGTYAQTALDDDVGSCDLTANWQEFTFTDTFIAVDDALLGYDWQSAICEAADSETEVWVEFRTGNSWTEVSNEKTADAALSCEYRDAVELIDLEIINDARNASGTIRARFRIQSGCPAGIQCGFLGETTPTNCGRRFDLSYDH
ncbi:MAG: hypothetical protein ACI9MR_003541 [Myxococcota bacterium]|jgi:hypothetical protein